MATQTFASTFSADAVSAYIAKQTLDIAQKNMVWYQLATKAALPKGEGRTFQYTRFERLNLPQVKITEGVTPSDSSMSISTVTAVMDQWGAFVTLSDVAIDSVKHPVLQQAIELLGTQAAETMDREMINVALAGTNVFFPGGITARGSLGSTNKISSTSMGAVVSTLRSYGAQNYEGAYLMGVWDPFSEEEITGNDTTFVDASKYGMIKNLMNNEVGAWKGIRWVRCNFLPKLQLLAGGSAATSATGGSLVASTTYNASLAVVDAATGFETHVGASFSGTTGGAATSLDITIPSLPSDATAGSTYNIYFGSNGGTRYLVSSGNAAGAVKNIGTLPSSGTVAQAAPAASIKTRFAFVLGKGALQCAELNKMQSYLTPAQASDSDPLVQRRKAGWKCDFKGVIANQLFMGRLEHTTTNN